LNAAARCSTFENVLNDLKERFGIDISAIWGMSFENSLHHRIVVRGGEHAAITPNRPLCGDDSHLWFGLMKGEDRKKKKIERRASDGLIACISLNLSHYIYS
jgi:hypothetical protein